MYYKKVEHQNIENEGGNLNKESFKRFFLSIRKSVNRQRVMDFLTVASFVLTVGGLALAIHVYFRDVRPVIESAELYEQIGNMKKEIKTKEKALSVLDQEFKESTNKVESLEGEIVGVYKAFYLETVSLELENEEIGYIFTKEGPRTNLKADALKLLKEIEVENTYQIQAMDQALSYVEEKISPDSEYYELRFYKVEDAIDKLKEALENLSKNI